MSCPYKICKLIYLHEVIPFLNQDVHAKTSEQRRGSTDSAPRSSAAPPPKCTLDLGMESLFLLASSHDAFELFGVMFLHAGQADRMAEFRLAVAGDIVFELFPIALFVADVFAVSADRQDALQDLNLGERRLQVGNHFFHFRMMTLHDLLGHDITTALLDDGDEFADIDGL